MSTLAVIVLVIAAVLGLLALGGALAQRRRLRATEGSWHDRVQQADHDLAAAVAQDRGWEYARLEAAARTAFTGGEPEEIVLVEVVDRPGTDEDRAVFRVTAAGAAHRLELARRGDEWLPA